MFRIVVRGLRVMQSKLLRPRLRLLSNPFRRLKILPQEANPEARPPTQPLGKSAPMLDVHPAHHAATTWRDFFIHIATIVLGLLIAVGLEQTVELVHRHHEAREARENIHEEIQANIGIIQNDLEQLSAMQNEFARDLDLLDSNQPEAQTIAQLHYTFGLIRRHESAWNAAKINGSLALLPSEKTNPTNYFYETSLQVQPQEYAFFTEINTAQALLAHAKSAGKLTAFQRQQLLEATVSVLGGAKALAGIYGAELVALQHSDMR